MISAVVIGNGESRNNIDLPPLRTENILIGCNAIHRDVTVDHLICCDRRMAEEATNNERTLDTLIYVREDWFQYYRKVRKLKNIRQVPGLPYIGDQKQDQHINWGSGCYAVLLAAQLGCAEVTLLGFDLYATRDKVNNVYKGTANYSKSDAQAVDPSYWIYQIGKVFKHYPDTKFIITNYADWVMPREWQKNNVSFVAL